MTAEITTEEISPIAYPLVNKFFKANGHKGKAKGNERVFVLKNHKGSITAALRAINKESGYLLRSVQVDQQHLKRGLGSQLVRETLLLLQPCPCWCYPFQHLQHFYEQCGFRLYAPEQVNPDISEPFIRYREQGQKLFLMGSF